MGKIAFVFPGQGAQKVGMGKEFYETSPIAKEIFDKASEAVELDLKALCFEENDDINITGCASYNKRGYHGSVERPWD